MGKKKSGPRKTPAKPVRAEHAQDAALAPHRPAPGPQADAIVDDVEVIDLAVALEGFYSAERKGDPKC